MWRAHTHTRAHAHTRTHTAANIMNICFLCVLSTVYLYTHQYILLIVILCCSVYERFKKILNMMISIILKVLTSSSQNLQLSPIQYFHHISSTWKFTVTEETYLFIPAIFFFFLNNSISSSTNNTNHFYRYNAITILNNVRFRNLYG